MNYNNGLKILEAFAKLEDEQTFREFDLAKSRLIQSLSEEKLFGPNEVVRSNINRVIYQLNDLTRRLIGKSFIDLSVDTDQLDKLLEDLLCQTSRNKVREVATIIVHNQLSPNLAFLNQLVNTYQISPKTDFGEQKVH